MKILDFWFSSPVLLPNKKKSSQITNTRLDQVLTQKYRSVSACWFASSWGVCKTEKCIIFPDLQYFVLLIHGCLWTALFVLVALWVFYCIWYSSESRNDSSNYLDEWQNPWQRLTNASCSPHLRIGLCRIKSLALPWAPQLCTELGTLQSQRWIHPSEMCLQTNFSQQTKDFWDLKLQCSVWTMANLFITFKLYRR